MATLDPMKRAVEALEFSGPADRVFPIIASATDLAWPTKAIRANGAGSITFVNRHGETWTAKFTAGETRAIRAKRVTVISNGMDLEGIA